MTYHLSDEQEKYFYDTLEELCRQSRLLESHRYMQHGDTSVFRHSVSVAYFSYYLALKMNAPVDIHSLVRGALLHDYFCMTGMRKMHHINGMDFIMQKRRVRMQPVISRI